MGWAVSKAWSTGRATCCPYSNSCGLLPVDWEVAEFIASMTWGRKRDHSSRATPWSERKQRKTCSTVLCARSVYPSVCGWKAVESLTLVPRRAHSYFQKEEVNLGSLSWSTELGTPYLATTCAKNKSATSTADNSPSPMAQGTKTTYLDSVSTEVKTQLNPWETGKSVMKSMLHVSKRAAGTSTGYIKPG